MTVTMTVTMTMTMTMTRTKTRKVTNVSQKPGSTDLSEKSQKPFQKESVQTVMTCSFGKVCNCSWQCSKSRE